MKNYTLKIARFLKSEEGATAVEYGVMVALIIAVCVGAIGAIGTKTDTAFETVDSALGTAAS